MGEIDVVTEEVKDDKPKEKSVSKKRPRSRTSLSRKNNSDEKETVEKEKEQKPLTERDTKEPKTAAKKKEKEPKTPVTSIIERPVRERKSVERLVTTIEKDSIKDVIIEKGRGTALKDIPNVAYKLSRKKNEDILKLLHTVLFGRRGKAGQLKNNISRFSGFVWHDNEEKQLTTLKEKLDKFVKEKLVEFCEVLDVPISKVNLKKEDIIVKLIEFLVEPHATTADLLAEEEQGKKRKRVVKSDSTPSKGPAKSQKKTAGTMSTHGEPEDESEEREEEEDEKKDDLNGVPENSDDEMSEQAKTEEKGSICGKESIEQKVEQKSRSSMPSAEKVSRGRAKTKKVTVSKTSNTPPKNAPAKSSNRSKSDKNNGAVISSDKKKQEPNAGKYSDKKKEEPTTKISLDEKNKGKSTKMSSDKKKEESTAMKSSNEKKELTTTKSSDNEVEESTTKNSLDNKEEEAAAKKSYGKKKEEPTTKKSAVKKKEPTTKKSGDKRKEESITKKEEPVKKSSTPKKTSVSNKSLSKESTGKSILKVNDNAKEEAPEPSNDDIRKSVCKILMEVDFNTASFTDVMKLLAQQFDVDLTPRKADIRGMIQQELTKLAETDDEEDDASKDEKNPSSGVKA
ncbi:DEK domain-containing chromatin associated protein [Striga asiatica]|uniref:DEK domain-containing chromatin associated protein n=1 Tax=Striga asiatica TaxID=4170 RepID=A0A5A7QKR8_STRAF|nr:DEK domain-containing chromatin associated protein [Striga asiatica]